MRNKVRLTCSMCSNDNQIHLRHKVLQSYTEDVAGHLI